MALAIPSIVARTTSFFRLAMEDISGQVTSRYNLPLGAPRQAVATREVMFASFSYTFILARAQR